MQAQSALERRRIAGYCRISVDVEADRDNTSIENQKAIIRDYVEKRFPDSTLDFYVDRDRSGYTFDQRESYQQMRPHLMLGDYDILIVKDLSRFSRRSSTLISCRLEPPPPLSQMVQFSVKRQAHWMNSSWLYCRQAMMSSS